MGCKLAAAISRGSLKTITPLLPKLSTWQAAAVSAGRTGCSAPLRPSSAGSKSALAALATAPSMVSGAGSAFPEISLEGHFRSLRNSAQAKARVSLEGLALLQRTQRERQSPLKT